MVINTVYAIVVLAAAAGILAWVSKYSKNGLKGKCAGSCSCGGGKCENEDH